MKRHGIDIVVHENEADVRVLVTERRVSTKRAGAAALPIGTMVVAVPLEDEVRTIEAVAWVGDRSQKFEVSKTRAWSALAGQMSDQIHSWLKDNDAKIRELAQ